MIKPDQTQINIYGCTVCDNINSKIMKKTAWFIRFVLREVYVQQIILVYHYMNKHNTRLQNSVPAWPPRHDGGTCSAGASADVISLVLDAGIASVL